MNAAWLSRGDGPNLTSIDMFDSERHVFLNGGMTFTDNGNEWVVSFRTLFRGSTADEYREAVGAVEDLLYDAPGAAGEAGQGDPVVLTLRFGTTYSGYLDVLWGKLLPQTEGVLGFHGEWVVELHTRPHWRRDPLTFSTTGTLANGAAEAILGTIPGQLPALAEVTLADTSTGGEIIQGWLLGALSQRGLVEADYDFFVPAETGAHATETADAGRVSGAYQSLLVDTDWAEVAQVSRPAGRFTEGVLDVWGLINDEAAALDAPRALSVESGAISIASGPHAKMSTSAASSATLNWPAIPTVGDYLGVLVVYVQSTTITTPSGWTLAPAGVVSSGAERVAIYYRADLTEAAGSVAVTFGGSSDYRMFLLRLGGIDLADPLDDDGSASGSGITASSGTATTTQANTIAIAAIGSDGVQYGALSNNFTLLWRYGSGYPSPRVIGGYRRLSATGSYSTSQTTPINNYVGAIAAFNGDVATADVPSGEWEYRVSSVDADGNLSVASPAVSVTISGGAAVLSWEPPEVGSPVDYRVFRRLTDGSVPWTFSDVGSDATTFSHTTETGAGESDPPTVSSNRAQFRLSSGVGDLRHPWHSITGSNVGGSVWEWLYLGTLPLPPQGRDTLGGRSDWTLGIEARSSVPGTEVRVDTVALLPHGSGQLLAEYLDAGGGRYTLATASSWRYRGNIWGGRSGTLLDGGSPIGVFDTSGPLYLGPGPTKVGVLAWGAGGEAETSDTQFTLSVTVWPRYRSLPGRF